MVVRPTGAAGDGTGLGVCGRREGMGDVPNEITCNHAGLAEMLRGQVSGQAMKVCRRAGGVPRGQALSEEPADHARQDIPGTGCGHSRVAGRADGCQTVWARNHRTGAFENDKDASFSRKSGGRAKTVVID